MIRIGKNEDSDMKIAVGDDASIWPVPPQLAREMTNVQIAAYYEQEEGKRCEVLDNFNFTATIIPVSWYAHSESGTIVFEDESDPFVYIMTQRNLLGLLQMIIRGYVQPTNRGLSGLFTFDRLGNTGRLTINAIGSDE